MKIAPFVLASLLAAVVAAGTARADELNPPSGPVIDDTARVDAVLVKQGPGQVRQGPARDPAVRAQRRAERQAFRQMMLQRFDANGDGRLEPAERKHAIKALRHMARQLARQERRGGGGGIGGGAGGGGQADRGDKAARRQQRLIQKYDLNHDGVVDANEMPPGLARKLQRLDRNHDGWVDGADQSR